jgi:hypothetical protein
MFHKFKVIQMFTELPRLCTTAFTLATLGWRNSFYACRFGLEFGQSTFIYKLRPGGRIAAATAGGADVPRLT